MHSRTFILAITCEADKKNHQTTASLWFTRKGIVMHVQSRCPSCQGSGRNWIGSSDFMNCLKCHGTGRVTEYINTAEYGGGTSSAAVNIDTRTDEEKKIDGENAIASFLSFCLGGLIIAPVLMKDEVAWWLPTVIGIVFWITMTKVLQGPLRIISVLVRKLLFLIGTLLAYTMVSLFAGGCIYVVIKIIQEAN